MVAVGKGGKILSRDCDLIIADDIEDHGTTIQPSAREQTRGNQRNKGTQECKMPMRFRKKIQTLLW